MIDFNKQKTDKLNRVIEKTVMQGFPDTINKLINFTNGINVTGGLAADNIDDTIIGATTPASGAFTTGDFTSQVQGDLLNNQMTSLTTFDVLGLMTAPIFLNMQCNNPGAGIMYDCSGNGHNGAYQAH